MANILKGKPVSLLIDQKTKEIISGKQVTLATIRVSDNKDDIAYENNIAKKAANIFLCVFKLNRAKLLIFLLFVALYEKKSFYLYNKT